MSVEKIALYGLLRESALKDTRVLLLADWAQRRLLGGGMPVDLADFLGRYGAELDGLQNLGRHPVGIEFDGLADDWHAAHRALKDADPITQAAALFTAWRAFGLSGPGAAVEAGVAAMKIGAKEGRALRFLPVAAVVTAIAPASGKAGLYKIGLNAGTWRLKTPACKPKCSSSN